MANWQPIETAPNGVSILVHHNNGQIDLIDGDDNDYNWVPYDGKNKTAIGIAAPTHWMPLPEPPK